MFRLSPVISVGSTISSFSLPTYFLNLDDAARRWVSVGRVATGLTDEERGNLCMALEKHWVSTRNTPPPPQLDFNKEKPDFWILPEHSTVFQVSHFLQSEWNEILEMVRFSARQINGELV